MKTSTRTRDDREPSLISDIGAIAGLYRTIFWMMGQRLHHGPAWQEHLEDEAGQFFTREQAREANKPRARRH
jgi:hypothetical protein